MPKTVSSENSSVSDSTSLYSCTERWQATTPFGTPVEPDVKTT